MLKFLACFTSVSLVSGGMVARITNDVAGSSLRVLTTSPGMRTLLKDDPRSLATMGLRGASLPVGAGRRTIGGVSRDFSLGRVRRDISGMGNKLATRRRGRLCDLLARELSRRRLATLGVVTMRRAGGGR